jgi:hypothetical protein
MMRPTLWLLPLLLPVLPGAAGAQETKPKKAPPEPKTWMVQKGELLWEERFEGAEIPKEWRKGQGDWKVEEGQLLGAELPADKHHAYASRKISEPNVVIQFSFKLDGAGWLGGFFDGKEHVAALRIDADSIRLRRMSGMGPGTRSSEIDMSKAKLGDGAWHSVVWEFCNDEVVATVDDKDMAFAQAPGLSMERLHLELNTGGGKWARFRDVKVWKAEPDKSWPQKKARLMQLLKKKPAKS